MNQSDFGPNFAIVSSINSSLALKTALNDEIYQEMHGSNQSANAFHDYYKNSANNHPYKVYSINQNPQFDNYQMGQKLNEAYDEQVQRIPLEDFDLKNYFIDERTLESVNNDYESSENTSERMKVHEENKLETNPYYTNKKSQEVSHDPHLLMTMQKFDIDDRNHLERLEHLACHELDLINSQTDNDDKIPTSLTVNNPVKRKMSSQRSDGKYVGPTTQDCRRSPQKKLSHGQPHLSNSSFIRNNSKRITGYWNNKLNNSFSENQVNSSGNSTTHSRQIDSGYTTHASAKSSESGAKLDEKIAKKNHYLEKRKKAHDEAERKRQQILIAMKASEEAVALNRERFLAERAKKIQEKREQTEEKKRRAEERRRLLQIQEQIKFQKIFEKAQRHDPHEAHDRLKSKSGVLSNTQATRSLTGNSFYSKHPIAFGSSVPREVCVPLSFLNKPTTGESGYNGLTRNRLTTSFYNVPRPNSTNKFQASGTYGKTNNTITSYHKLGSVSFRSTDQKSHPMRTPLTNLNKNDNPNSPRNQCERKSSFIRRNDSLLEESNRPGHHAKNDKNTNKTSSSRKEVLKATNKSDDSDEVEAYRKKMAEIRFNERQKRLIKQQQDALEIDKKKKELLEEQVKMVAANAVEDVLQRAMQDILDKVKKSVICDQKENADEDSIEQEFRESPNESNPPTLSNQHEVESNDRNEEVMVVESPRKSLTIETNNDSAIAEREARKQRLNSIMSRVKPQLNQQAYEGQNYSENDLSSKTSPVSPSNVNNEPFQYREAYDTKLEDGPKRHSASGRVLQNMIASGKLSKNSRAAHLLMNKLQTIDSRKVEYSHPNEDRIDSIIETLTEPKTIDKCTDEMVTNNDCKQINNQNMDINTNKLIHDNEMYNRQIEDKEDDNMNDSNEHFQPHSIDNQVSYKSPEMPRNYLMIEEDTSKMNKDDSTLKLFDQQPCISCSLSSTQRENFTTTNSSFGEKINFPLIKNEINLQNYPDLNSFQKSKEIQNIAF